MLFLCDFASLRRNGIGKKLFEAVVAVAKKMPAKGWSANGGKVRKLVPIAIGRQVLNWNKPAISFYRKYSTVFDNEWINCSVRSPFRDKLVFEK